MMLSMPTRSVRRMLFEYFEHLGGGKRDGGWDGSGRSGARLAILPSLTHYNIFSSSELAATVTQFLGSNSPGLE